MLIKFILMGVLALLPQAAFSQIFKCKGTKGKVTYSNEPCASGTKGGEIFLESNVIDTPELRNLIKKQKSRPQSTANQAVGANNSELSYNMMTSYDKELRVRELKIDMKNLQGSYEKRADATTEYNYLAKNPVLSLSYEDELKRRNLKVDLENYSQTTRHIAMQQLTEVYRKY